MNVAMAKLEESRVSLSRLLKMLQTSKLKVRFLPRELLRGLSMLSALRAESLPEIGEGETIIREGSQREERTWVQLECGLLLPEKQHSVRTNRKESELLVPSASQLMA